MHVNTVCGVLGETQPGGMEIVSENPKKGRSDRATVVVCLIGDESVKCVQ